MNDKIAKVEDLVNSGCESRHQLTKHIFVCDKFKTCPCAELCLNRDNEFTPEEAALVWMGMHRVRKDHNYEQEVNGGGKISAK